MANRAERLLYLLAVLCLLGVVVAIPFENLIGCGHATDDRASGYIDQPVGESSWSWFPPGRECRYTFDEAENITVTVSPPLSRIALVVLSVCTIAYLRRERSAAERSAGTA